MAESLAQRRFDELPAREAITLALVTALLAAVAAGYAWFERIDRALYDLFLDSFQTESYEDVVLITVGESSVQRFGSWPWPRAEIARAIDAIRSLDARRIGIDILFADYTDDANDMALARTLAAKNDVVLPMVISSVNEGQPLLEILPRPFIDAGVAIGHVHYEADDDGVVRRIYLWQGVDRPAWPHFALRIADPNRSPPPIQTPATMENVRFESRLVPFLGPPGTLPNYSIEALFDGLIPPGAIAGRDVLLGVNIAASMDSVATPATRFGRPMSGLEFNGNVLAAIKNDRLISAAATSTQAILAAAFGALPYVFLFYLAPRQGLLVSFALAAIAAIAALLLLRFGHLWAPPAAGIVGALLSFPLWGWRRLDHTAAGLKESLRQTHQQLASTPIRADEPLATDINFVAKLLRSRIESDAAERLGRDQLPPPWTFAPRQATWQSDAIRYRLNAQHDLSPQELEWLRRFASRRPDKQMAPPSEQLARQIMELRSSMDRLQALFNVAHAGLSELRDGVVLLGEYGNVLFANRTAEGIVQGSLTLDSLDAALSTDPPQLMQEAIRGCFIARQERDFAATSSDGREWLVHLSPERSEVSGTPGVAMLLVDISSLRKAERNRRETMSFLSHDLRSPIVSLLALTKRFRNEDKRRDLEISDLLNRLEAYAQRGLRNAEQFLQLTRVENEPTMATYELDLGAVAENAVAEMRERAREKNSILRLVDSPDPAWVQGNGEFLERTLMNLLDNAIKYSPTGSRITIEIEHQGEQVRCAVKDNGPGVEVPETGDLVRAFYRGKQHSGSGEGVGLGLRFAQVTAERHGGKLVISNNPEGGACFTLWLPRIDDPE